MVSALPLWLLLPHNQQPQADDNLGCVGCLASAFALAVCVGLAYLVTRV